MSTPDLATRIRGRLDKTSRRSLDGHTRLGGEVVAILREAGLHGTSPPFARALPAIRVQRLSPHKSQQLLRLRQSLEQVQGEYPRDATAWVAQINTFFRLQFEGQPSEAPLDLLLGQLTGGLAGRMFSACDGLTGADAEAASVDWAIRRALPAIFERRGCPVPHLRALPAGDRAAAREAVLGIRGVCGDDRDAERDWRFAWDLVSGPRLPMPELSAGLDRLIGDLRRGQPAVLGFMAALLPVTAHSDDGVLVRARDGGWMMLQVRPDGVRFDQGRAAELVDEAPEGPLRAALVGAPDGPARRAWCLSGGGRGTTWVRISRCGRLRVTRCTTRCMGETDIHGTVSRVETGEVAALPSDLSVGALSFARDGSGVYARQRGPGASVDVWTFHKPGQPRVRCAAPSPAQIDALDGGVAPRATPAPESSGH
jgi:hypothetical protein